MGTDGHGTEELLSVGEFAKLLNTTKATLRHYDQLGILPPAKITESGYRYYSADQAQVFLVIELFSDCGLTLKQIRGYLETFDTEHGKRLLALAEESLADRLRKTRQLALLLESKNTLCRLETTQEYGVPFLRYLPERHYFKSSRPIGGEERHKIHTIHCVNIARYVAEHDEFPEHPFVSQAKIGWDEEGHAQLTDLPEPEDEVELCTHPAGLYVSQLCRGVDFDPGAIVESMRDFATSKGLSLGDDLYIVDTINFVITQDEDEFSSLFFIRARE